MHTFQTKWSGRTKENAMYGPEVMLIMLVLRLVVPVGLLLWIGEGARRHQVASLRRS